MCYELLKMVQFFLARPVHVYATIETLREFIATTFLRHRVAILITDVSHIAALKASPITLYSTTLTSGTIA